MIKITAGEVRDAVAELGITQLELAREWGINGRTVRRWLQVGACAPHDRAFAYALRLHRSGIPWQRGSVAISFDGPLSDAQAAARKPFMDRGLLGP